MRAEELEQLIAAASASSEGEVVTRALSRDIKLPHTAGTAVLITLDNGRVYRPQNSDGLFLGPITMREALVKSGYGEYLLQLLVTG